ncbi:DUF2075 domain-containing protein [Spiroplasma turonicum]|uniref:ATP/GTP binding protein n=1 Tax=Spiroplasma turonicum TaxID=216946 RepID=A0A0K1P694_9MOLU|nr:DUF2075 domain-containing protein [Spiroplasma turonicum]AKU79826.1 ATP/GTP binding protein [Spiroplasma turonicum]ALX70841.1 ATP/GTP binding protein [Spiroplasma turonicum]
MLIYKSSLHGFIEDIDDGILTEKLNNNMINMVNKKVSKNEVNSWNNSLREMRILFADENIDKNIGIAIEYNLPRSNKRIDVILSGLNDEKRRLLIIELKQWEECTKVVGQDMIVNTYVGGGKRNVSHPSYQSFAYGKFLSDFSEVVYTNTNIEIQTCAYLHNYNPELHPDIIDLQYQEYINESPLFFKRDLKKFRNYIKDFLNKGDNGNLIDDIDSSKIRPGKSIQKQMRKIIDNKSNFLLLDDQKVIFENILSFINKNKNNTNKAVLIIPGGPGTGKTLIALKLLSQCIQNNFNAIYCTKNEAVRNVFKKLIIDDNLDKKYTRVTIDNLFYGSAVFSNLIKNRLDVTIVDEAHRLINRHQYTKIDKGYNNQIREIICESKVSVFFIDEKQIVTTKDIGSINEIKDQAILEGISAENIILFDPLLSQFRSSGADEYIKFIDDILYQNKEYDLTFLNKFDLKVFDNVQEMYDEVKAKSLNNSARVLAGYCWDWISKKDKSLNDIVIGDFKKQWNLENYKYYMLEKESINQIGCIHQSQGLEIDYAGVIIGPDMYSDGEKILTDGSNRVKTDKSIIGLKSIEKNKADEIGDLITRNTYNVLLTRAMKGRYIYCTDKNLSKFIKYKLWNIEV